MQSLAVIQALKPARIYPGHGPVVSDPKTHVQMYIDNRNNREKQILTALASGAADQLFSAMDLVEIIYTVNFLVVFIKYQMAHVRKIFQTSKLCYICKSRQNRITFLMSK